MLLSSVLKGTCFQKVKHLALILCQIIAACTHARLQYGCVKGGHVVLVQTFAEEEVCAQCNVAIPSGYSEASTRQTFPQTAFFAFLKVVFPRAVE